MAKLGIHDISFRYAIEAPLLACSDAQRQASDALLDYVQHDLLVRDSSGCLSPVYITFDFEKDGQVHLVRIPLMSLLPVSFLQIDDIRLHYLMKVTDFTKTSFKVRYTGMDSSDTSEQSEDCEFDIRLRAGVSDMPMGLAKLYQMLSDELTTVESIPK